MFAPVLSKELGQSPGCPDRYLCFPTEKPTKFKLTGSLCSIRLLSPTRATTSEVKDQGHKVMWYGDMWAHNLRMKSPRNTETPIVIQQHRWLVCFLTGNIPLLQFNLDYARAMQCKQAEQIGMQANDLVSRRCASTCRSTDFTKISASSPTSNCSQISPLSLSIV